MVLYQFMAPYGILLLRVTQVLSRFMELEIQTLLIAPLAPTLQSLQVLEHPDVEQEPFPLSPLQAAEASDGTALQAEGRYWAPAVQVRDGLPRASALLPRIMLKQ